MCRVCPLECSVLALSFSLTKIRPPPSDSRQAPPSPTESLQNVHFDPFRSASVCFGRRGQGVPQKARRGISMPRGRTFGPWYGGVQNVWGEENIPENALSRKFLDPPKRASGLLCRGFLYKKNRALTPGGGWKMYCTRGVRNPFLGGVSFVRFSTPLFFPPPHGVLWKLPRDNFCRSIASQLPSPRGRFWKRKNCPLWWARDSLGGILRGNLGEGNCESKIAARQWESIFCREASRCLARPSGSVRVKDIPTLECWVCPVLFQRDKKKVSDRLRRRSSLNYPLRHAWTFMGHPLGAVHACNIVPL